MAKIKRTNLTRDEQGAAIIELALFFPIFLIFFLGIIEIGFVSFGNSLLKNGLSQTARESMVGCRDAERDPATGVCRVGFAAVEANLKSRIKRLSAGMIDVDDASRFTFTADRINCFSLVDNGQGIRIPNTTVRGNVNLGQGGEIIALNITYRWKVLIPAINLATDGGAGRSTFSGLFTSEPVFSQTIIIRNEKFLPDSRRGTTRCS